MTDSETLTRTEPSLPGAPGGSRLCLIAGEGELPVRVAQNALAKDWALWVYTMDKGNLADFKRLLPTNQVRFIRPGLLEQNFKQLHEDNITHVVFAGKVNKWILFRSPVIDQRALALWKQTKEFNDDSIMLTLIRECEEEGGVTVCRQTDFLQDYFWAPGVYSQRQPTEEEQRDIAFGMGLAKEMGRLDVGQTVVVLSGMVLAVETIEGTDQAILRSGQWSGKKGGVVAKVEKPNQDLRFDVPTVGPRTLKAMKKSGLKVLAIEAGKTLVLQQQAMIDLANRWQMTLVAV